MLVEADAAEAAAIERAMRDVATARGAEALTPNDAVAVTAAHHYVFRQIDEVDAAELAPIDPLELADAVGEARLREHAVGFLSVMATVDGTVDPAKIAAVEDYATALDVHGDDVRQLAELAAGHLQWLRADMGRRNLRSVTGHDVSADLDEWMLPYRAAPDPALADRYQQLSDLPDETFGNAFHEFYRLNGFAFPGDPGALNAGFATPHDSTHVLSGYSTTPQGELLVSTFTAGMHPVEPITGHILPVIFSWHLGIGISQVAGRFTGALAPEKFWVAWTRGAALATDVFDPAWDFWDAAEEPLDHLRERYEVPPLAPALGADDHPPDWYRPTA